VLADCYRARREYSKVEELWRALGEASPTAELVEEGRIVYAGALADQGKLREAIRALEAAPKAPRKPKLHHLRRWYALADLYERGGDLKRAKRLFSEIDGLEPGFGDVRLRMSQLR
jgi:tetratricopeptide (TPR) repeat protein